MISLSRLSIIFLLAAFAAVVASRTGDETPVAVATDFLKTAPRTHDQEELPRLALAEKARLDEARKGPFTLQAGTDTAEAGRWNRLTRIAADFSQNAARAVSRTAVYREEVPPAFPESPMALGDGWGSGQYGGRYRDESRVMGSAEEPIEFLKRVRIPDVFALMKNSYVITPKDDGYQKFIGDWLGKVYRIDVSKPDMIMWGLELEPSKDKSYFNIVRFGLTILNASDEYVHDNSIRKRYNAEFKKSPEYPDALILESRASDYFQLYAVPGKDLIVGNYYRRVATTEFTFAGTVQLKPQ